MLLNETLPAVASRSNISEAERARRAYAVSFGVGSTRLEGGILTEEVERINASFVAGELTQSEWSTAVLASDTVRGEEGLGRETTR